MSRSALQSLVLCVLTLYLHQKIVYETLSIQYMGNTSPIKDVYVYVYVYVTDKSVFVSFDAFGSEKD